MDTGMGAHKRPREEADGGGEPGGSTPPPPHKQVARPRSLFYTLPDTLELHRTTLLRNETVSDLKRRLTARHGIPDSRSPIVEQRVSGHNPRSAAEWARLDHEEDAVEDLIAEGEPYFRLRLEHRHSCSLQ